MTSENQNQDTNALRTSATLRGMRGAARQDVVDDPRKNWLQHIQDRNEDMSKLCTRRESEITQLKDLLAEQRLLKTDWDSLITELQSIPAVAWWQVRPRGETLRRETAAALTRSFEEIKKREAEIIAKITRLEQSLRAQIDLHETRIQELREQCETKTIALIDGFEEGLALRAKADHS